MKHAAIVPLIGGMTIAARNVIGQNPDFIVSWNAFNKNEEHLTNYLGPEVPRYLVDESGFTDDLKARLAGGDVDLVTALCPCAGLSRLNTSRNPLSSGPTAEQNQWMYKSANLVLEKIKPKVLLGENAPGLVQPRGKGTLDNLKAIAKDHGYSFSTALTNSMVHGLPQNRLRSFYFFWKSDTAPLIEQPPKVPMIPYRDIIDEALKAKTLNDIGIRNEPITKFDPAYRYMLELHGMDHKRFAEEIVPEDQHIATIEWIIENGHFDDCMKYIEKTGDGQFNGVKNFSYKLDWAMKKTQRGMGFYYAGSYIINPNGRHNTFAGKAVDNLAHPYEDRYLNVREMMCVMRLPLDLELLNPLKNLGCIPQSVPVTTGEYFVKQAVKFIEGGLQNSGSGYVHQDVIRGNIFTEELTSLTPFFA